MIVIQYLSDVICYHVVKVISIIFIILQSTLDQSKTDQSLLNNDFYTQIQTKCFLAIYNNVYRNFKKTDDYRELTEQVL